MKALTRWLEDRHNRQQLRKVRLEQPPVRLNIRGRFFIFVYDTARPTMQIGERVTINSGFEENPVSGVRTTLIFMRQSAHIDLSDNVKMSNVTISAASRIAIGDNVMLGAGSRIFDHDFHSVHHEYRVAKNVGIATRSVIIESGAFVGADATILKGVTIGRRAVIGASAVVTRDVPAGEVWAGNPARRVGIVGDASAELPRKFLL